MLLHRNGRKTPISENIENCRLEASSSKDSFSDTEWLLLTLYLSEHREPDVIALSEDVGAGFLRVSRSSNGSDLSSLRSHRTLKKKIDYLKSNATFLQRCIDYLEVPDNTQYVYQERRRVLETAKAAYSNKKISFLHEK